MTTHVFIVDDNTFKYHLEYMFAGTGASAKKIGKIKRSMLLILTTAQKLFCMKETKVVPKKCLSA